MLKCIENCKIYHVLCDSNGHFIGILHLSLLITSNQGKNQYKGTLTLPFLFPGNMKILLKLIKRSRKNKPGNEHFKMGDKLIEEFFYD
jgi:hypothetical protein